MGASAGLGRSSEGRAPDNGDQRIALFGVFRDGEQGRVDDEMRRRMRLLAPACPPGGADRPVTGSQDRRGGSIRRYPRRLSAGVFLVDARAGSSTPMPAAGTMLHERCVLRGGGDKARRRRGRCGSGAEPDPRAAGDGDATVGARGIAVPLTGARRRAHVAHVLPLTVGRATTRRGRATRPSPRCSCTRRRSTCPPARRPSPSLQADADRAARAARHRRGRRRAGGRRGARRRRDHGQDPPHRLFAKTGTRRQADLVKLVAGFSTPLVTH